MTLDSVDGFLPVAAGRTRVSRNALASVDRVQSSQGVFAYKRFRIVRVQAWAAEVVSHLLLPLEEVAPLVAYGIDRQGRPWLATRWVDWPDVRSVLRASGGTVHLAADAWIAALQSRLLDVGYRWSDACYRNVLSSDNDAAVFLAVDYTLRPLRDDPAHRSLIDSLARMPPGCEVQIDANASTLQRATAMD